MEVVAKSAGNEDVVAGGRGLLTPEPAG